MRYIRALAYGSVLIVSSAFPCTIFPCMSQLSTLKMEAAVYFEMWAYVYQTTRLIVPEDRRVEVCKCGEFWH